MSYSSMKLPELKAELKKRGLPTTGKKEELIKRLKEAPADDWKKDEVKDVEEEVKSKKGKRKLEEQSESNSNKREKLAEVGCGM